MKRITLPLALTLLILALLSWAAVAYFDLVISGDESQYQADVQAARQSFTEQNSSVSMHAVVQDTAASRAQLDALLSSDVTTIANKLRGVGQSTGVSVKLGGALPENGPVGGAPATSNIQAVAFSLEADGSFAALMRTEALIEALPLPSSIERFDIQRASDSGATWHMSVSIRVLTASPISS